MSTDRTSACIEKAKELMAETSADSLRCATLQLRMAIEYLFYDVIARFPADDPDDVSPRLQPREIIEALLCESHADQDAAIAIDPSSAPQSKGTATSVKEVETSSKQLIKQQYHRLGAYLHAPVSLVEPDLSKWRSDLEKTIDTLEQYEENEEDWFLTPRKWSEIGEAGRELFDKVWYNRHQVLAEGVQSGEIRVVDKVDHPSDWSDPKLVCREVWKRAREEARRMEQKYGTDNLGPWDDFEWGMINGKLSALNWLEGWDWDMLDT